jgi:hypothetical protein
MSTTPRSGLLALISALQGDPENECELDPMEVFEAVSPFLDKVQQLTVGQALELCPDHFCDYRICLDDGLDCRAQLV